MNLQLNIVNDTNNYWWQIKFYESMKTVFGTYAQNFVTWCLLCFVFFAFSINLVAIALLEA